MDNLDTKIEKTINKVIPYSKVIKVIKECKEPRTQAIITIQYAFATRIGELAEQYIHYYYKYSTNPLRDYTKYVSEGPRNKSFSVKEMVGEISFLKPNFKQKKVKKNKKEIVGIDRFPSFLIRDGEPFLYDIVYNWIISKKYEEPIFNLKQSRLRKLVDTELKQHDPEWSSHWLRHSRAWHIGEATGDPYAVQAILGHSDLNTSLKYVSKLSTSLRKLFGSGQTMEDYLGKVIE